jgi:mannose-6-phosphate isomerase-like protein (cupin superfamily)
LAGGSFAHFQLEPGEVSRAVSHVTVEEIWYVVEGIGRMWRRDGGGGEQIVPLSTGVCLTIPLGTAFQFRADGSVPLRVVAVTMPPWPVGGDSEARTESGAWPPAPRR